MLSSQSTTREGDSVVFGGGRTEKSTEAEGLSKLNRRVSNADRAGRTEGVEGTNVCGDTSFFLLGNHLGTGSVGAVPVYVGIPWEKLG